MRDLNEQCLSIAIILFIVYFSHNGDPPQQHGREGTCLVLITFYCTFFKYRDSPFHNSQENGPL